MRPDGSITHWIHEIKDGNRDAAQVLWERYFTRLVNLARKELAGGNRRVSDEEDLAVGVFECFCRAAKDGRFPDLSDRDSLWRLLVKMTARRSIDQHRKHSRLRRGGGNVRGESVFHKDSGDDAMELAQVIGNEPTPEFVVTMSEEVGRLLELLEKQELKDLAIAKMEGYTNEELAKRHQCSTRTIERRVKLIRVKLNEELFD